uniref:Mitochondrial import inner membrane translocase subunit Tim21 n=1 Tax=Panagrolaimus sp. JU765 TaxID=591449 RepID=A0AC34PWT2_9BILA
MMKNNKLWILSLSARRLWKADLTLDAYIGISRRLYASDVKSKSDGIKGNKTAKEIGSLKGNQSYLDEILIGHEEQPKTTAQKVKKKAENTFYYVVFFGSVVALGALGYYFIEQFLAPDSPQTIYSKALKLVRQDDRCEDLYGPAIKGFGEDTGRGRRRHIANHRWMTKDGEERVRIMFHVKGERHTGKVFAEVAKKDGNWEDRFVYTVTDDTVPKTVVLLDNRENR